MRLGSRGIALLAVLTAIPTALGYVLGPLSRSLDALLGLVPFLPVRFYLGFIPLVISTILARACLGRGGAVAEGLLLAVSGVLLHPTQPAPILLLRDILLGVGVEVSLLGCRILSLYPILLSSLLGGLASYLPYLLYATPLSNPLILYASWILLMSNKLISALIGGYLAYLILRSLRLTPLKDLTPDL